MRHFGIVGNGFIPRPTADSVKMSVSPVAVHIGNPVNKTTSCLMFVQHL